MSIGCYCDRTPKVAGTATAKKAGVPNVMERFLSARAQDALGVYKELDESERKSIFDSFKAQNSTKAIKISKGIDTAMARAIFAPWYANELWGEPSAQALAQFIERFGAMP